VNLAPSELGYFGSSGAHSFAKCANEWGTLSDWGDGVIGPSYERRSKSVDFRRSDDPIRRLASATGSATVEASAAVESATRGDCAVSREAVPNRAASFKATPSKAPSGEAARTCKSAGIRPSPTCMSPAAVVPGACADKDSAREPARTVIAIRCASIWIVGIVPVSASWRSRDIAGADADSNAYSNSCHDDRSLRVSERHSQ